MTLQMCMTILLIANANTIVIHEHTYKYKYNRISCTDFDVAFENIGSPLHPKIVATIHVYLDQPTIFNSSGNAKMSVSCYTTWDIIILLISKPTVSTISFKRKKEKTPSKTVAIISLVALWNSCSDECVFLINAQRETMTNLLTKGQLKSGKQISESSKLDLQFRRENHWEWLQLNNS